MRKNVAYFIVPVTCMLFSCALSAMEGSSYPDFEGMNVQTYVTRCMPKVPEDKRHSAQNIITDLINGSPTLILEDDFNHENEVAGKEMTEGGASFPHSIPTQGPFLEYCGSGSYKHILEIGPGNGDDTIAFLLTHNTQVIAVDIQQKQLGALSKRVKEVLAKDFPKLLAPSKFCTMKRNFALEGTVPAKYIGAFHGANISRVFHFLDKRQAQTLTTNIATMLAEDSMISVTVSYLKPGSREEGWSQLQETEGLEDPNLVYYDIVTKATPENKLAHLLGLPTAKEFQFVPRRDAGLSGPGYKRTTLNMTKGEHRQRTGRYYHNLESLSSFLKPHFTILDSKIIQVDVEDSFISVIARKK